MLFEKLNCSDIIKILNIFFILQLRAIHRKEATKTNEIWYFTTTCSIPRYKYFIQLAINKCTIDSSHFIS